MFSKIAARDSNAAARAKIDRLTRDGARKALIEDGETIPLGSTFNVDDGVFKSRAAQAARIGFLVVVATAARTGASEATQLAARYQEAYNLAIGLLRPYINRGRKSQKAATLRLLTRGIIATQTAVGSTGVTVTLSSIILAAKKEFTRLTGTTPSSSAMPNFIRHLSNWANASIFLGEIGDTQDNIHKYQEYRDQKEGEVMVLFTPDAGSPVHLRARLTIEKMGNITYTKLSTTKKWVISATANLNDPLILSCVDGKPALKEGARVSSMEGISGTVKVIGVKSDAKLPYLHGWADACAVPPEELDMAAYMCEWWERECTTRISQMGSVTAEIATAMEAGFQTHPYAWFVQNKFKRAREAKGNANPFHFVDPAAWKTVANQLLGAGPEIALRMLSITDTLDSSDVQIDKAFLLSIWKKAFPSKEHALAWKKFIKMKREAAAEKRKNPNAPGPSKVTPVAEDHDYIEHVERILKVINTITDADTTVTIRQARQGITVFPSVGFYLGSVDESEWSMSDAAEQLKALGFDSDVEGEINHNEGLTSLLEPLLDSDREDVPTDKTGFMNWNVDGENGVAAP